MDRLRDRQDAGRRLADRLKHLRSENPVILALPRGGVPVAAQIAKALEAPLDVLIVRKIGAPGHEELGLGAIVGAPDLRIVWNEDILSQLRPPQSWLDAEVEREQGEIERRAGAYRGDRKPLETKGRTVIVVDDGIATGGTVRAALQAVRRSGPARLVLAVGVAPVDSLQELRSECDEVVCLQTPSPFFAVGAHYASFAQTGDDEVIALLQKGRRKDL